MRLLSAMQNQGSAGWSYAPPAAGITNSTSDVAAKAAVANSRNLVGQIQVSISVVLANATTLVIKSGSTVLWRGGFPVTAIEPKQIVFDPPLRGGVNEAINIAVETIFATGNMQVNAQGYTIPA